MASQINRDFWLKTTYVHPSIFNLARDEQEPGKAVELAFPRTGVFAVMCPIHPKMLLNVTVD